MSESQLQSLNRSHHTHEQISEDSTSDIKCANDALKKSDINSNISIDLIIPQTANDSITSCNNKAELENDDKPDEEEDTDCLIIYEDDGACSRSRPYVRGQREIICDRQGIILSVLTKSSSERSISSKDKDTTSQNKKAALMPTPPEDSDLPTLLPKHATPSETPAEKCEKVAAEGPDQPIQTELNTSSTSPTQTNSFVDGIFSDDESPIKRCPQLETQNDESENSPPSPQETEKSSPSRDQTTKHSSSVSLLSSLEKLSPSVSTSSSIPAENAINNNSNKESGIGNGGAPKSCTISIYPNPNSNQRKGSNIPVGIAVAWQRLVTTSNSTTSGSGNCTVTTVTNITSPTSPVSTRLTSSKDQMQHHNKKGKHLIDSAGSPVKVPLRPSSASPVGRIKSPSVQINMKSDNKKSTSGGSASASDKKVHPHVRAVSSSSLMAEGANNKCLTPDLLASAGNAYTVPNRPMPSSSVPPNLGLPYGAGSSLMDYSYGGMRSSTPFPSVNSHNLQHLGHFPPSWPSASGTDLSSVPQGNMQGFHSLGSAAYLQQSMQNQMQIHQHLSHHHSYSNYYSSSYLQSGYDVIRQHYEQVLMQQSHHQQQHQNQQAEFLRQYHHIQHQQQQLLLSPNGSSSSGGGGGSNVGDSHPRATPGSPRISIPTLSPSPGTGVARSSTPNTFLNPSHHHLHHHHQHQNQSSLSNLSATGGLAGAAQPPPQLSNWPLEFYHHNSSTTLSPKSLTSSTPSPVTVQSSDTFSSNSLNLVNRDSSSSGGGSAGGGGGGGTFLGRKCATPNPISKKTFSLIYPPVTLSSREEDELVSNVANDSSWRTHRTKHKHMSVSGKEGRGTPHNEKSTLSKQHKLDNRLEKVASDPGVKHDDNYDRSKVGVNNSNHSHNEGNKHDSSSPSPQTPSISIIASPLSMSPSPSYQHKHDFSRMESLIEKRSENSVHMLNASEEESAEWGNSGEKAGESYEERKSRNEEEDRMNQLNLPSVAKVETDFNSTHSLPLPQLSVKSNEKVNNSLKNTSDEISYPGSDVAHSNDPSLMGLSSELTPATATAADDGHKDVKSKTEAKKEVSARKVDKAKNKKNLLSKIPPIPPTESIKEVEKVKRKQTKKAFLSSVNQSCESSSVPEESPKKVKRERKYERKSVKKPVNVTQSKPKEKKAKRNVKNEMMIKATSNASGVVNKCENYKGIVVPESNLPVDPSSVSSVVVSCKNNGEVKPNICTISGQVLPHPSPAIFLLSSSSTSSSLKQEISPEKVECKLRTFNSSDLDTNDNCVRKIKTEHDNNNDIYANRDHICISDTNVSSKSFPNPAPTTAAVIFTNQNQSFSLNNADISSSNGTIGNISTVIGGGGGPLCVDLGQSNHNHHPVVPATLLNSPVTLILPRIMNSHTTATLMTSPTLQTSFKLVVASQEIKIPGFLPPSGINQQHQQLVEQGKCPRPIIQNVNLVASSPTSSSAAASSASILASPCDSRRDILSYSLNESSPTVPAPAAYQVRQDFLPQSNGTGVGLLPTDQNHHSFSTNLQYHNSHHHHHSNKMVHSTPSTPNPSICTEVRRASCSSINSICAQREFIDAEDNHLNLLATVAQEFGSRDDLGKLVSSNASSGGGGGSVSSSNFLSPNFSGGSCSRDSTNSLMTSPVLNYSMRSPEGVGAASSSVSTSLSTSSFSLKKIESISLPTSPVPMNRLPPEYKENGCKMKREKSTSSQEHEANNNKPHVWLKIPHVIPKAAEKVAEKLLKKKQQQQEKSASKRKLKEMKADSDSCKIDSMVKLPEKCNKNPFVDDNTSTSKVEPNDKLSITSNKIQSEAQQHPIPKLKIPKITQSLVKKSGKKVERKLSSTEKIKKVRRKSHDGRVDGKNSSISLAPLVTEDPVNADKIIKMKLPVPKVAKLRIKLSESKDPVLMSQSLDEGTKSLDARNSKKNKIRRRHSDGDKLSRKKKNAASFPSSENAYSPPNNSGQKYNNEDWNRKRKHSSAHDSFSNGNEEEGEVSSKLSKKSAKNARREQVSSLGSGFEKTKCSTSEDLSSFFTSLTPPPTAKLLEDPSKKGDSQNSRHSHSIFSSPNNNLPENHNESSATETENENENEFNWVSDPTFAASAIRLSATPNASDRPSRGNRNNHNDISTTRGDSSTGNKNPDLRKNSSKLSSKLSIQNQIEEDTEIIKSSFVHFAPKRVKASSSVRHHHIKPCLKAEPIVRPLSSISSSSENDGSDDDIDLEVATLTNSISPTHKSSFRSPYISSNLSGKSQQEQKPKLATSVMEFGKTSPMKYTDESGSSSVEASGCIRRRPSLTHYSNNNNSDKHVSRRRLSMNIDIGRSQASKYEDDEEEEDIEEVKDDEEELLDIPEDFPSYCNQSSRKSQLVRRYSQSCEYENKKKNNSIGNKNVMKGMSSVSSSPSFSNHNGGSSKSGGSKKSPRKRSSRSSTTTSTNSGIISSSSSSLLLSNNKSTATTAGLKDAPVVAHENGSYRRADVPRLEDETLVPGKIKLESVAELLDEMRILTEIQGLFYTGKLNALQPPDVYGVTLDNERGAPPHLIFSAEEVLEKCIKEKKPQTLSIGLRICAYWSPQYSGLYPGRVSTDFNPHFDPEKDLIPIEFDDGDTGMIKLGEIRLLPKNHPIREYDPNPLLTLEKKHRKRRHSSANTNSGRCTGEHEEADCGESFCAKVAKFEEEEEEDDEEFKDKHHSFKSMYWTWTGLGYKRPKSKKNRNKEFFRGIQRGDEIINVGDSAIFISHGNERPYIGRVEKFWEKKGQKVVNVRWFYHPEEVKSPKRIPHLKYPGALFESPHIDENDVQTIGKKCDVLPFSEFKERIGKMPKLSLKNSNITKPKDLYYVAGYYDPYTYNLQLKI